MENKDTNTDYQEVVRAGDQMREMEEIASGTIFLVEIHNYYFLHIQEIFLKKIIPIQSASSYSKSEFDLSSYYINLLKNGSPLSPSLPRPLLSLRGMQTMKSLWIGQCLFLIAIKLWKLL